VAEVQALIAAEVRGAALVLAVQIEVGSVDGEAVLKFWRSGSGLDQA